ncbi:MAG: hypothetical protein ACP5KN_03535 [Armatimonadota bacterium]
MRTAVHRIALAGVLAASLYGVMAAVYGKTPWLGFGAAARSADAPQPTFVVSGLMGLDGEWIALSDIDDAGRIAGSASDRGQQRAVIWDNGRIVDLATPADRSSRSVAVGAGGCVVGTLTDPAGEYIHAAFLRDPGGQMFLLEARTAVADARCDVWGMNDLGQVVGCVRLADDTWEPAVWDRRGAVTTLGVSPGCARDINNSGQIAGYVGSGPAERAAVWESQGDGRYALTWLALASAGSSRAVAINDAGTAVGRAFGSGDGGLWAFTYDRETGMRELPRLGATDVSWACDISDTGWIVGCAVTANGPRAVLWIGDRAIDLNDCIDPMSSWELTVAAAVNDLGDIIGRGLFADEDGSSFVLRPEWIGDGTGGA